MASEQTVEERLAALEAEVAELKRLGKPVLKGWLAKIDGIITDEEAFDEMLAYGREFRRSQYPPGDGP